MTTIPTIHKHPSLTIGKYSYQVYKLGDTPQTSTLIVRRVSNPAIAWAVSLASTPEYATSCRVAIPKAVYKQALELLTTGRVELFPLDAPTLTAQTINPPTPTPLRPTPALRLSPDALKDLINLTCGHDASVLTIEYTDYPGTDIDCNIALYTASKQYRVDTQDYSKLQQVLSLLGYEVFCHSSNRDILISLYNIHR